MKRITFLITLILILSAGSVFPADWPCFRADQNRSATVKGEVTFPLKLQWEYTPSQPPERAWPDPVYYEDHMDFDASPKPIIAQSTVYIGSSGDDTLRAFDLDTGNIKWSYTTDGPIRFAPAFMNGNIYLASDDGFLYCLDASSGDLKWKFRGGLSDDRLLGNGRMISRWPLRSGVIAEDGIVYFTAGMWPAVGVFVYALDAETGKEIWCNDTCDTMAIPQPHPGAYGISGVSPQGYMAAAKEFLIIPVGKGHPARFERATGKLLGFDKDTLLEIFATPRRFGGPWVAVDEKSGVYYNGNMSVEPKAAKTVISAYRLADGKSAGSRIKPPSALFKSILVGSVLFKSDKGTLAAYKEGDGKELWTFKGEGSPDGLAYADGKLVAATTTGKMYCFGSKTSGTPAKITDSAGRKGSTSPFASEILKKLTSIQTTKGYALFAGGSSTLDAEAIARETDIRVICVFSDRNIVEKERKRLRDETGMYGSEVSVLYIEDLRKIPFSPYIANLVVMQESMDTDSVKELYRILRPCGGIMAVSPSAGTVPNSTLAQAGVKAGEIKTGGNIRVIKGKLEGAFDWDSKVHVDHLVKWPLELSWFGGPGPAHTAKRNGVDQIPRVGNGIYFAVGDACVIAVDAYNGTELWVHEGLGVPRQKTLVSGLAADDNYVYIKSGKELIILESRTGKPVKNYPGKLPAYAGTWGRSPGRTKEDAALLGEARINPLTGEKSVKSYVKSYGCGGIRIQSATMDFLRSSTLAYYDYISDMGIRHFGAIRPACGPDNMVAGLGLLLSNEGRSMCTCSYNFLTSLGMVHTEKKKNNDWGVFQDTQVKEGLNVGKMLLNFAAPGDKRDDNRMLWQTYPRPYGRTVMWDRGRLMKNLTLGVPFLMEPAEGTVSFRVNPDRVEIQGTDKPWLYSSMISGVSSMTANLSYYDPRYMVLSYPAGSVTVNGSLDEKCWDGSGIAAVNDKPGMTMIRHDKENLYVGYRLDKKYDRKGNAPEWKANIKEKDGPVWEDDAFELTINTILKSTQLHLGVSPTGARYDGIVTPYTDIPKLKDVDIDGNLSDWGSAGIQISLKKYTSFRIGWDEKGLLFSAQVKKAQLTKRWPFGMLVLIGDKKAGKLVQVNACYSERKITAFNASESIAAAVGGDDKTYLFEYRVPWSLVGGSGNIGNRLAFVPIPIYSSTSKKLAEFRIPEKKLEKLKAWYKGFNGGRGLVFLNCADKRITDKYELISNRSFQDVLGIMGYSINHAENKAYNCEWKSAVRKSEDTLEFELAIPLSTIQEAGLDKNNLLVNFGKIGEFSHTSRMHWAHADDQAYILKFDDEKPPRKNYTVRLHFAELEDVKAGERVFDIKIQGKTAAENFDIAAESGGKDRALVKEFNNISAQETVNIEFVQKGSKRQPAVSGIEIFAE